jgi:hypothetical protein
VSATKNKRQDQAPNLRGELAVKNWCGIERATELGGIRNSSHEAKEYTSNVEDKNLEEHSVDALREIDQQNGFRAGRASVDGIGHL